MRRTENGVIVPCQNCTERVVGCHSKCTKYKEFQKENNINRKNRFKQKGVYTSIEELHKHRMSSRKRKEL